MKNKLLFGGIIAGIILCLYCICFAGEKEELKWQEVYYLKTIQSAQYEIVLAQNELKNVQNRLEAMKRQAEEAKKPEIKKEEVKK